MRNYINKRYAKKFDNDLKISNFLNPEKNIFIFLSSRRVYKSKENIRENDKLKPLTNYSKNKLITENLLKNKLNSNILILRLSKFFFKTGITPS